MKICLITPAYSVTTEKDGATPVIHYFAKEWVKQGHKVVVFYLEPQYPDIFYFLAKKYQFKLNSLLGMCVPTVKPHDYITTEEGVNVRCITYRKIKPHSRLSKSQLRRLVNQISDYCSNNGVPDVFIGHWTRPQVEILPLLKEKFGKTTCLVFHSNTFNFPKSIGPDYKELLSKIDILGFRNRSAQRFFEEKYWKPTKSFIAYSGVSDVFLRNNHLDEDNFNRPIRDFIFVGSLMSRKYPKEVLESLNNSDIEHPSLTYIGEGDLRRDIEDLMNTNTKTSVHFTGRIPRESIVEYLKNAQVFVMISKAEIFGLVYLEAMALGLIPIGSRNEGIDGIIVDGVNGFLCEAGNKEELKAIVNKIAKMDSATLKEISKNAITTANNYSDKSVAERYINYIKSNLS